MFLKMNSKKEFCELFYIRILHFISRFFRELLSYLVPQEGLKTKAIPKEQMSHGPRGQLPTPPHPLCQPNLVILKTVPSYHLTTTAMPHKILF